MQETMTKDDAWQMGATRNGWEIMTTDKHLQHVAYVAREADARSIVTMRAALRRITAQLRETEALLGPDDFPTRLLHVQAQIQTAMAIADATIDA